jgi:hypothetical protein
MFYDRGQVQEGYAAVAKDAPAAVGLTAAQIKKMQAAGKTDTASDKAAEAAVAKPKAVRKAKAGQDCGCGCGGTTKGGRFLPGHDARFHAAERAKAAEAAQA